MKGDLTPADVPSKWMKYTAPDDMLVAALCAKARLDPEDVHTPLHVGTVRYRGWRGGGIRTAIPSGRGMDPNPELYYSRRHAALWCSGAVHVSVQGCIT